MDKPLLTIGKIKVGYLDALNWTVIGDGQTTYHPYLAGAIKHAIDRALKLRVVEGKIQTAREWLQEYEKLAARVEKAVKSLAQVVPFQ